MEQLNGQDATFLYMESPRTPMHVSGLSIYDPSTAPGGEVRFKQILDHIGSRIHLVRALRQKLVRVPLELDFPYWINDPDFDLEFHVRHIALPAPGDWRQLCIQVARLHSRMLDLSKPLWEMYVIEGLDNIGGLPKGSYAILSKFHHAAIDGATGAEITAVTHDLSPESVASPPDKPFVGEQPPSALELLARTFGNNIREPFKLMEVLSKAIPAFARTRVKLARNQLESAGKVPDTIFNRPVSAHRVFEGSNFDLADLKSIKNVVPGATINDAVVSVVGGAVRCYLKARGALPEESLIAMAPINVRKEEEKGTGGNQVSAMAIAVRSDIADPLDRLRAVHQATKNSKALSNAYGARLMTDINKHIPAATQALAGRLVTRWGVINRFDPIYNLAITNVPGPQVPLYMNGARLVTQYGLGPLVDSASLFIAVLSYNAKITISVTSCRELMPDPAFFASCVVESVTDSLLAAQQIQVDTAANDQVPESV